MRRTSRRATLLGAAVTGAVLGAVVTLALTGSPTDPSGPDRASGSASTTTTPASAPGDGTTSTSAGLSPSVLLVWTSGGLPAGFADVVGALPGVEAITMVLGDETRLTRSTDHDGDVVDAPAPGWHIPLDTLAVDPSTYATFVDDAAVGAVRRLGPGQALLTEASSQLRGLGAGATIRVGGHDLTVAGVVDDASGAGAELIVGTMDAERLGVTSPRFLLVLHAGTRDALQRGIAEHLDGRAVRFRGPGETRWLRHGDAVEPAVTIKAEFGEFAIRDRGGRDVQVDPSWVARWIVTEEVPILGAVRCHRQLVEPLRAALDDLEQANLAHLVDASAFAGCFAPRRIAAGEPLSHHAWGVAVDLNVDGNPRGSFSTQDARLVETMARHGFSWGGTWLVPDPAHYEARVTPG